MLTCQSIILITLRLPFFIIPFCNSSSSHTFSFSPLISMAVKLYSVPFFLNSLQDNQQKIYFIEKKQNLLTLMQYPITLLLEVYNKTHSSCLLLFQHTHIIYQACISSAGDQHLTLPTSSTQHIIAKSEVDN